MERKSYGVGLVGYGSSAKTFHIPFLLALPSYRIHAILQRQVKPGGPDASIDVPNAKIYRTLDRILQSKEVQLVIITTPPETHRELVEQALRAGKHVVVEKPFTPTRAEAEELISLAKARNLLLTVYQNRRWDSDFLILKAFKEQGTLGRIVEFESHFDRYRPQNPLNTWKAHPTPGNAAIYDLGAHLLDQIVHLFGLPAYITAFLGSQRTTEDNGTGLEDSFTVLLHYPDGMLATVKAGVISPESEQLRFWVRGSRATFRKYGLDLQEVQLKRGMQPGQPGFGIEAKDNVSHGQLTTVQNDGVSFITEKVNLSSLVDQGSGTYLQFYIRLLQALESNSARDLPVQADEAAQVIQLIELAKESSRMKKTIPV